MINLNGQSGGNAEVSSVSQTQSGASMVCRKSSSLRTRWSMASSATFAMRWSPRIWYTWRHQSDTRAPAEDDPQKQVMVMLSAPCPQLRLRGLEFTLILWCAPGYFNSQTFFYLQSPSPPRDGTTRLENVERPSCLTSLLCPSCVDPPGCGLVTACDPLCARIRVATGLVMAVVCKPCHVALTTRV